MIEAALKQGGPDPPSADPSRAVALALGEEPPTLLVECPNAEAVAEREASSAAPDSAIDGLAHVAGWYGDPVTRALKTSIATDVLRPTDAIDDLIEHAPGSARERKLLADLKLQRLVHTYERRENEQALRRLAAHHAAAKERVQTWLIYAAIPAAAVMVGLYSLGEIPAALRGRPHGGAITIVATSLLGLLSAVVSYVARRRAARRPT